MSTVARLDECRSLLAELDVAESDAERIEQLDRLERIKAAAAAAQARITDAFARSQRARLAAQGVDGADARRSIAAQVALARRDSPARGGRHVGLAAALVRELPAVLGALAAGETTEWRATLVARETAHLSAAQRATVDAELAGRLGSWGDVRTADEARRIAQRLDPAGAEERAAKAVTGRRVTIRPAPDAMSYLTALLPAAQGIACYAALHRLAAAAAADPADHRTRGQVMADEFRSRLLGAVADGDPPGMPAATGVEVHLVMTDRTLLDGDDEPAYLVGHGPVPAPLARRIAVAEPRTRVWVRRLFTDPADGTLVATDARRRVFPHVAREFLAARDLQCRTPFCGAAIRHADHTLPVSRGGPTDLVNASGRCESCNYVKETPGWTTETARDGTITITTPTGHRHRSRPPGPPRSRPWRLDASRVEHRLELLLESYPSAS